MRYHEILEVVRTFIVVVLFYKYLVFQVLESREISEPAPVKKNVKKSVQRKASTKVRSDESSGSSDNESDEEEDEVKPRNKSVPKGKMQNSNDLKKRKRMANETNISGKKRIKPSETEPEDKSDAEVSGNVSEDDRSQSSAEKPVKVIT